MVLFLGIGPPFVNPGVCPFGQHLYSHEEVASSQWSTSILLGGALPLSGSCPLGWVGGRRWRLSRPPDATCRFSREEGTGSRRDFFVGCPNALTASVACFVTDRWFTPHFSVVARFCIGAWMADVACPNCLSAYLACLLVRYS